MPHNTFVDGPLLTVVETSAFARRAEKLLTAEEYDDLLLYLATYYRAGDEIPGTNGVRKLRYAAHGRGKSGGVRVIYYFFDETNPILALFLYGKNEQANLTPSEKKAAASLAAAMKAEAKARRVKR
ncbi:MAG: type II toxin-antitoxin system RelE/ParE family toxin [Terracidiphilus sp.]